jgi:hypothetical protein
MATNTQTTDRAAFAEDPEHVCCLSCTLLSHMSPAPALEEITVPAPYPTTGSVVLTAEHGRVLRVEDLGPVGAGVVAAEISSVVERDLQHFGMLVRGLGKEISAIVDEGMCHVEGGGYRNPGRYANRIMDLICERIGARETGL